MIDSKHQVKLENIATISALKMLCKIYSVDELPFLQKSKTNENECTTIVPLAQRGKYFSTLSYKSVQQNIRVTPNRPDAKHQSKILENITFCKISNIDTFWVHKVHSQFLNLMIY